MRFDTLVLGGTLCTHDHAFAGDLAITEGKIAAIARPGDLRRSDARSIVDARGSFVMPGLVAMDDVEAAEAPTDDEPPPVFARGVLTSLRTVTPDEQQTLRAAFLAQESLRRERTNPAPSVDVGWHLAITRREHVGEIGALADLGVTSFAVGDDVLRSAWADEVASAALLHRVALVTRTAHAAEPFMARGVCVLVLPTGGDAGQCILARNGSKTVLGAPPNSDLAHADGWRRLTQRVDFSPSRVAFAHAAAPAQHLGLWGRKGGLLPGFDADMLVVAADSREIRCALLRGHAIAREASSDHAAPAGIWLHRARLS